MFTDAASWVLLPSYANSPVSGPGIASETAILKTRFSRVTFVRFDSVMDKYRFVIGNNQKSKVREKSIIFILNSKFVSFFGSQILYTFFSNKTSFLLIRSKEMSSIVKVRKEVKIK